MKGGAPGVLRVLGPDEGDPAWQMAMDEALLDGASGPTLRFYLWRPAALSLGWFQRPEGPVFEAARRAGLAAVRRLTGGGAIVHADELTYALAGPDGRAPFDGAVDASYRLVHEVIAATLRRRGAAVAFADDAPGALSHAERPFHCFARTTRLDLVAGGGKLVGSAKRRRGGRALQHGSILLGRHPLQQGAAALRELVDGPIDAAGLAAELAEALATRLGMTPVRGVFRPAERAHARSRRPAFVLAADDPTE